MDPRERLARWIGPLVRQASSRGAAAGPNEAEHRYRALVETAGFVVLCLDLDHRIIEWNPTAERIYGWKKSDVLGRNYLEEFVPEEFRDAVAQDIRRVLGGLPTPEFENPVRTRDGSARLLRWSVTRLEDDRGLPSGILALGHDITDERQRAEEQRRLVAAMEQAGEAIVIVEPGLTIAYANPAFARMTRKPLSAVIGAPFGEIIHSAKDWQLAHEILTHTLRGEEWSGRYETEWDSGERFVRTATVAPVRDESGRVVHVVAVLRDVTREVELEADLLRSQKLTALGTLAGGIAHDFNNLLTVVLGGGYLLLEELDPDDPNRVTVEEILDAAQRGADLSRQLVAFGRRQTLHPEVLDLAQVVADLKPILERLVGDRIELVSEGQAGLWTVMGERSQIERVILNLVLNARDAMPEGGRLVLTTSNTWLGEEDVGRPGTLAPGDYVTLTVTDTGVGMDEETRARAFEPFFTRKQRSEGTGLGLATVYGITRQTGGDVTLQSSPGKGSRLAVHLPRCSAERPQGAERPHPTELRGTETILLVEDEDEVRRTTRRSLEGFGYTVLEAASGDEALEIVRANDIDLLLSDVRIPETNSLELAVRIRQERPRAKLIFMSGHPGEGFDRGRMADAGWLEKPFTPITLAEELRSALGRPESPPDPGDVPAS